MPRRDVGIWPPLSPALIPWGEIPGVSLHLQARFWETETAT